MNTKTQGILAAGALVAYLVYTRQKAAAAAVQPIDPGYTIPTFNPGGIAAPSYISAPNALMPALYTNAQGSQSYVAPPVPVLAPTPQIVNPSLPGRVATQSDLNAQNAMYANEVGRLQTDLAAGRITKGTAAYASRLDYIANLKGGVATKAAELAKLNAVGL